MSDTHIPESPDAIEVITARTQRRVTELMEEALRRPRLHILGHGMVEIRAFSRASSRQRGIMLSPLDAPGPIGRIDIADARRSEEAADFSSIVAFDNLAGLDAMIETLKTIRAEMVLDAGPAEP
ncbi:hypothetical protein [Methylobacterium ajmalii]|uniref:hypothetical protein n=1 Tax=Methylobacterium ajmalii TaxID=2738439 RepID=UPI002F356903